MDDNKVTSVYSPGDQVARLRFDQVSTIVMSRAVVDSVIVQGAVATVLLFFAAAALDSAVAVVLAALCAGFSYMSNLFSLHSMQRGKPNALDVATWLFLVAALVAWIAGMIVLVLAAVK